MKKILLLSVLSVLLLTGCGEVARGSKIGQVVKVNEASGLICKTVEVEIIRGGFSSGSGAQGSSLQFTIENNPKNVELLKKAMLDGSEVEVSYNKEIVTFCRSDSDNVFGLDIKLVKQTKASTSSETKTSTNTETNEVKTELLKALKLQNEAIQKLLAN